LQKPLAGHWSSLLQRMILAAGVVHLAWVVFAQAGIASSIVFILIAGPCSIVPCVYAVLRGDMAARYLLGAALLTFAPFFLVLFAVGNDQIMTLAAMSAAIVVTLAILQRLSEQQQSLAMQASQAQDRERFLATMSHEIRTPLNGITGFVELIGRQPLQDELRENFNHIDRSARMLMNIVNDVLDFSKIQAGGVKLDKQPVAIGELVEQAFSVVQFAAREKNVTLVFDQQAAAGLCIEADFHRCSQVLINLCSNAIKFSEGGQVALSARASDDGERVLIQVQDTGVGMTADTLDSLFKPFEQASAETARRFGGTGLGLAIAKQLTTLMNGTLHAESEPGRGSVFTLTLPRADINDATAKTLDESITTDVENLQVLLVEDNPVNRILARKILQDAGVVVAEAESGETAIELVSNSNNHFDLILMDMQLPSMDGVTATRLIREQGHTLPIIALTANNSFADKRDAKAAGMTDYVSKPFRQQELLAILSRTKSQLHS